MRTRIVLNNYERRKDDKGFTLIELLGVIALLAIIFSIVIYAIVDVIDNAKNKSYQVTINNVEKAAENYITEYQSKMFWINESGTNKSYQCISVQDLIDTGYFKSDLLDSKVSDERTVYASDKIYVVMDNSTKTIIQNVLLYEDDVSFNNICSQVNIDVDIDFSVPDGWAREKDVNITYRLSNANGIYAGYGYNYFQDNDSTVKKDTTKFTNVKHVETTKVTKNGFLNASILDGENYVILTKSLEVTGIDNVGPVIVDNYIGSNTVVGSVIIPIKVTDVGSGVDGSSFTSSDMVISIGEQEITSGITLSKVDDNNYNLKIENIDYEGQVKIVIDEDKVFDKIDNGNEETILTPGISFVNTFKIKYNANGGTGTMTDTSCKYGKKCTLRTNTFTREGYKFIGWSENRYVTTATYSDGYTFNSYNKTKDITLYAVWEVNTYTVTTRHYLITGSNEYELYKEVTNTINHGTTFSPSNVTAPTGYHAKNYFQYYDASGNTLGSGTVGTNSFTVTQKTIVHVYYDLDTYTISYNANGGSGTMTNTSCTYGRSCTLRTNTFTREGYKFIGWSENQSATTATYSDGYTFSSYNKTKNITLYAVWENVTYNITYDLKGGTKGAKAPTSGTSGSVVEVSNPTKGGFTFNGWTITGTGASISGTNLTIGTSDIKLTASWTANLVEYIEYLYSDSSLRSDNSLKKDTSSDANIRYVGSSPKNYVTFNGELWRIIGTFNVSNGSTTTKRVKLIRESSLLDASWDSCESTVNNGKGINEWSQADLKVLLNDYYAGNNTSCRYCNGYDQSTCSNSCTSTVAKLGTTALNMIDNAVWNLGSIKYDDDPGDEVATVLDAYNKERGSRTGRQCSKSGTEGNCTDNVSRTTTWTGKIGLIYPSDYGYASTDSNCHLNITYNSNCQYNNWLSTGAKYWTMTPRDSSWFANAGSYVSIDSLPDTTMGNALGIRPSLYLKGDVQVIDGEGTSSSPYILDMLD